MAYLDSPNPVIICSECKQEVKAAVWDGRPVCHPCYAQIRPHVDRPWIKVFFCEGNPGHGYISAARAKYQDSKELVRTTDGGTALKNQKNPVYFGPMR